MKNTSIKVLALLFTIAQPLLHTSLLAQENTTDSVIVTATRLSENSVNNPANVTIISAKDIENSPAKTLPELLTLEAGVTSRSLYGNGAARATVDIRGFGVTSTQNTLILLDGRRLNDIDLSAVDYASIPINNIQRIEISRGNGVVLYGDGAVGGVINIITKTPGKMGTTGSAVLELGSHTAREIDASLSHVTRIGALSIAANVIKADGYRDNNKIDQKSLQADFRLPFDSGEYYLKLGADDQGLRLPGVRTVDPTTNLNELANAPRGTNTLNDFAERAGFYATIGASQFLSNQAELIIDMGFRNKNEKSFFDDYNFGGAFASYLDTDLETWSFTPRMKLQHNLAGNNSETITGIDFYHSQYDSDRALNRTTVSTPIHKLDINQTSLAVYGHNNTQISKHSNLTVGARYQRVKSEAGDTFNLAAPGASVVDSEAPDNSATHSETGLELGIHHSINDAISFFSTINRSFRVVTVDEMFSTFPGAYTMLTPQTSRGVDVGMKYLTDRSSLQASIYYMRLKNEIHYDSATFSNVNLDPTKRHGIEITGRTKLGENVALKGNVAYTRAKFRKGTYAGNNIPIVPKHTASLTVKWDISSNTILSSNINYIGEKYFDNDQANTSFKIPDYTTVGIKLAHTVGKWQLEGKINNLFDKKAFDYGVKSTATVGRYNAYPLPERILSATISRSF